MQLKQYQCYFMIYKAGKALNYFIDMILIFSSK